MPMAIGHGANPLIFSSTSVIYFYYQAGLTHTYYSTIITVQRSVRCCLCCPCCCSHRLWSKASLRTCYLNWRLVAQGLSTGRGFLTKTNGFLGWLRLLPFLDIQKTMEYYLNSYVYWRNSHLWGCMTYGIFPCLFRLRSQDACSSTT